jgi:hypothetical protein
MQAAWNYLKGRIIDFSSSPQTVGVNAGRGGGASVSGFTLLSTSAVTAIGILAADVTLNVARCSVYGLHDSGWNALQGGVLSTDTNCTAVKCAIGIQAIENGTVLCDGVYVSDCTTVGCSHSRGGYLRANSSIVTNSVIGYYAQLGGIVQATAGGGIVQ